MRIKTIFFSTSVCLLLFLSGIIFPAFAQDNSGQAPESKKEVDVNAIPSLLFTYWEHTAIMDAKKDALRQAGVRRNVTEDELQRELRKSSKPSEPRPKPPPEMRELRLGGIAYTGQDDWTIWLNEQRITPSALPEEIIDLRVRRHYIEVKWYDDYTAQIFPIKLKPHQRFNLDSRIFLPG